MLGSVVPGTALPGPQQDLQHLRITRRAHPREGVDDAEQEAAREEAVEQVERRRADEQREEEQPAIDAADRQRSVERSVDGSVVRQIRG